MQVLKGKNLSGFAEVSKSIDYSGTSRKRKSFSGCMVKAEGLSSVDLMASGMSHDIKNMLTNLSMVLTFLSTNDESENPREQAKRLRSLNEFGQSEIKKVQRMVEMLASLQQDKKFPEVFDVNEVIQDATKPFMFISNKLEVSLDLSDDLPRIYGDRIGLSRAIMNICLNSLEAMNYSGNLSLFSISTPREIRIIVSDSGPGISASDIDHIFDPQFTTKETGSGYGLSVVSSVVMDFRGSICVRSLESDGTQFMIALPIYEQ